MYIFRQEPGKVSILLKLVFLIVKRIPEIEQDFTASCIVDISCSRMPSALVPSVVLRILLAYFVVPILQVDERCVLQR